MKNPLKNLKKMLFLNAIYNYVILLLFWCILLLILIQCTCSAFIFYFLFYTIEILQKVQVWEIYIPEETCFQKKEVEETVEDY